MTPLNILQLSDCHLTPTPGELFRGVNPRDTLVSVVKHIRSLPMHFDYLLLTGDLVHHGDATIYQELIHLLAPLQLPISWIAGNHDDLQVMLQADAKLFQSAIDLGPWQIITVDSNHAPNGCGSGSISDATLNFIAKQLDHAEKPTLLVMHHHPIASGTLWQDQIMLGNADQFWSVISFQKMCKAVICGHLHQALEWQHQGVSVWSAPSTAAQFCPNTDHAEIEQQSPDALPGYRWYQLWPDGRIDAYLERAQWSND